MRAHWGSLAFAILVSAGPVMADDWDTMDRSLLGALIASTAVDCLQTQYIFDNPDEYQELNPVIVEGVERFGEGFIPIYFIGLTLLDGLIADWLSSGYRKGWLGIRVGGSLTTIHRNYAVGVKLSF